MPATLPNGQVSTLTTTSTIDDQTLTTQTLTSEWTRPMFYQLDDLTVAATLPNGQVSTYTTTSDISGETVRTQTLTGEHLRPGCVGHVD